MPLETLKLTGMPPIEQITTISAHIFQYQQELTKLEAMRDEVLEAMIRRARPSKSLPVAAPVSTKGGSKLAKKLTRHKKSPQEKYAAKQVDKAKLVVLEALRKSSKPLTIRAIIDQVPHTFYTVRKALNSLRGSKQIKPVRALNPNNVTATYWQTV